MLNITFHGDPLTVPGSQLSVGDTAPDFTAIKKDLSPVSLKDLKGVKIISAVPSLDTSVCQVQTKKFNQQVDALKGVTLVTISLDLPFAQGRWCGAEGLENSLTVSDYQEREFATKFNLLIKELKLLSRSVFVLDQDNVIRYVEYVSEVTAEPNYDAALACAKSLL
ncbi:MAG: thiol peroxidase [Brevinema sp.]